MFHFIKYFFHRNFFSNSTVTNSNTHKEANFASNYHGTITIVTYEVYKEQSINTNGCCDLQLLYHVNCREINNELLVPCSSDLVAREKRCVGLEFPIKIDIFMWNMSSTTTLADNFMENTHQKYINIFYKQQFWDSHNVKKNNLVYVYGVFFFPFIVLTIYFEG